MEASSPASFPFQTTPIPANESPFANFPPYHAVTLQAVANAVEEGKLSLPVAVTSALADINQAYAALATGPSGKIVLEH